MEVISHVYGLGRREKVVVAREGEERESEERGSEPRILTLAEAPRYLRVHPLTITRMLKKNEFPGFKVGRHWRFNLEDIDELRFGSRAQGSTRKPRRR